ELADDRMQTRDQQPAPAGLGPVGRGWSPRLARAGTFDDDWKRRRWPLRPHDYDPAHDQSAPDDQQFEDPAGGLELALVNMTPSGLRVLRVPTLDVPVQLFYEDRWLSPALRVDTVLIEPERNRLELTGRVVVPVERRRPLLREIVLGHVSPGWIKARREGKCHLDLRTGKGDRRVHPCFSLEGDK
ncbi:MAG: DUF2169 domain-containing protein, partial [Myxococcales bacterium]|nr:DUF2169 domain-containing protein [Myxococcales bacterium]